MPADHVPPPVVGAPAIVPEPALWCSDCHAPLRLHYYALDERPVCGKCRLTYAARIARGTGAQALWRAVAYGLGAAIAGASMIGIIIQTIGFGRLLCAIAIGWMVGMAINRATGDYLGLRYRLLAVVFTYFAIGLGSLSPIIVAMSDLPDELVTERTSAALEGIGEEREQYSGSFAMEMETLDEIDEELREQELARRTTGEQRAAAELAAAGPIEAALSIVMLIFVLPLLSLLTFGVYGAVVGLLALAYGIWKAWELTGKGVDYVLQGPYRVGTGPILVAR